jgi:hypothetical protein
MWKGYEFSLVKYLQAIIREWTIRGYRDTRWQTWLDMVCQYKITFTLDQCQSPWWLGNDIFHASHRSALLHKNYDHYKQFGWSEKPNLNYFWPKEISSGS